MELSEADIQPDLDRRKPGSSRHDPCVGIRATPIAEAFLALVLVDHALRHRAQNADAAETVRAIPAAARTQTAPPTGLSALEDPDPLEA